MYIGVDIGGTFTDIVFYNDGDFKSIKILTCSKEPTKSILKALDKIIDKEQPVKFLHSTTLVTNMILEHKGVKTAFITSSGMKDILHIGRHSRPLNYAIKQKIAHQHAPPCSEDLRFTVPERIDFYGNEIIKFEEDSLLPIINKLKEENIESLGIGFLHSYLYPKNELLAYEFIKKMIPSLFISLSEEVSPRFREFERFMTTAWNARIAPIVIAYLTSLRQGVKEKWPELVVCFMTSNGGLEELNALNDENKRSLIRTPIRLALSGPAAAGNAIKKVSDDLNIDCCVGLDIGGTSSDIVIVNENKLKEAAWEDRVIAGYSIQIPMLDVHTIGAGGGSIINRDKYGVISIGPNSAGANPGPACYSLGGVDATLTDAAVISGRLPSNILLGGTIPIDATKSIAVFPNAFHLTSNNEIADMAIESLLLAESKIAFAIREKTIAKGVNPKDVVLIAAGGAGPLFACGIADVLDIKTIILPPRPGLLSAWGLLSAPERHETTISILKQLDEIKHTEPFFKKAKMSLATTPSSKKSINYFKASLRYLGQGFEIEIKTDACISLETMRDLFNQAHKKEYGFSFDNIPIEWIDLTYIWEKPVEKWDIMNSSQSKQEFIKDKAESYNLIWEFDIAIGKSVQVKAAIFEKNRLYPTQEIDGPAIIIDEDTTMYIASSWSAYIIDRNYIQLKRK